MNKENIIFIINSFSLIPYNGKIILNNISILKLLSDKKIKNLINVLKKLEIKKEEENKIWFIDNSKLLNDKNLKIYYIPLNSLEKLIITKNLNKLPDPLKFLIGLTLFNNIKKDISVKKVKKENKSKIYIDINRNKLKQILDKKREEKSKNKNNSFLNKKKIETVVKHNTIKSKSPKYRINNQNKFIFKLNK